MEKYLCGNCWKYVDDLYPSNEDHCPDCHHKLSEQAFLDEFGASYEQLKTMVSTLSKKNRQIAELEAENAKLKAALISNQIK